MKSDGRRIKCPECGCKIFKVFEKDETTKVTCRNCDHVVIEVNPKK